MAITLFSLLVSTDFTVLSQEPFKKTYKVERVYKRTTLEYVSKLRDLGIFLK